MSRQLPSTQVGQATVANFSTSAETDILVFNDQKILQKPILTFFYNILLSSSTSLDIRYYAAFVYKPTSGTGAYVAGDWFLLPGKTSATISVVSDTFLRVITSTISFVDSLAASGSGTLFPACAGFKVTGKGAGAATASATVTAMVRDN